MHTYLILRECNDATPVAGTCQCNDATRVAGTCRLMLAMPGVRFMQHVQYTRTSTHVLGISAGVREINLNSFYIRRLTIIGVLGTARAGVAAHGRRRLVGMVILVLVVHLHHLRVHLDVHAVGCHVVAARVAVHRRVAIARPGIADVKAWQHSKIQTYQASYMYRQRSGQDGTAVYEWNKRIMAILIQSCLPEKIN